MWKGTDWTKFYNVADHLKDYSEEEEYQRSASGRYYYSCFGLLRYYYRKTTHRHLPFSNAHSVLIEHLENSNFVEEQKLGFKLKALRLNRIHADYKGNFDKKTVVESKDLATEIIDSTNKLIKNPLYSIF